MQDTGAFSHVDGGAEEGGDGVVGLIEGSFEGRVNTDRERRVGAGVEQQLHDGLVAGPGSAGEGGAWILIDDVDGGLDGGQLEEVGHGVGAPVVAGQHQWRPAQ